MNHDDLPSDQQGLRSSSEEGAVWGLAVCGQASREDQEANLGRKVWLLRRPEKQKAQRDSLFPNHTDQCHQLLLG